MFCMILILFELIDVKFGAEAPNFRDVASGHPGAEQGSKGATVLCIMTYVN